MKPLDTAALEFIREKRLQGVVLKKLVPQLQRMGYSKLNKKPLCTATLSHFLCANGLRTRATYKHRKGFTRNKSLKMNVSKTMESPDDFLLDVIANKKLSRDQKIKVLTALI
jgi:hypothetical protein